jgi:hypothetical protein
MRARVLLLRYSLTGIWYLAESVVNYRVRGYNMDWEIKESNRIVRNKCAEKEREKSRNCRIYIKMYDPWEPFWDVGC